MSKQGAESVVNASKVKFWNKKESIEKDKTDEKREEHHEL